MRGGLSRMKGWKKGIFVAFVACMMLLTAAACAEQVSGSLPATLCITEVMTDNEAVFSMGFEDYIELYNGTIEPIQLSEYYLSEDRDDPMECRLPKEELAPGAYRVLSCDGRQLNMKKDGSNQNRPFAAVGNNDAPAQRYLAR